VNYQHTSAVLVGDRRLAARRLKNNVQHQPARTYENEYGKEITSVEHRAGWDATFSAPKSVSLTALVRGDLRVREAHREAYALRSTSCSGIPRRASAISMHRRQLGISSQPHLSTILRDPWTATPLRNSRRTQ
jgi:TrwC relaxase